MEKLPARRVVVDAIRLSRHLYPHQRRALHERVMQRGMDYAYDPSAPADAKRRNKVVSWRLNEARNIIGDFGSEAERQYRAYYHVAPNVPWPRPVPSPDYYLLHGDY